MVITVKRVLPDRFLKFRNIRNSDTLSECFSETLDMVISVGDSLFNFMDFFQKPSMQ